MEDGSDDELLATQLATATQPPHSADTNAAAALNASTVGGPSDTTDRELCAVCSLDMTRWTILDRAVHMNACLDAATLRVAFDCPACGRDLTDYNEQRRTAHVNICLDRLAGGDDGEQPAPELPATVSETSEQSSAEGGEGIEATTSTYKCKICGEDLTDKSLDARIRHVKQCGQRFGVRPSDLAASSDSSVLLGDGGDPTASNDLDAGSSHASKSNAFDVMMRASATTVAMESRGLGLDGSNAFDVMMKSSRTEAVLSSKRQRVGGSGGGGGGGGWRFSGGGGESGRRRLGCPEFKRIKGTSPPFIVDGFQYATRQLSSVYFLSHFHSDHYGGIQKTFDCGVIYCNEVTARLVVQELGVASKFVHPVPMDRPVVVSDVEVTFMDANHCPGAAIILFRLKNGKVYLHTGDFRFDRKMLALAPLQRYVPVNDGSARLDGVYLDTTYADPKYTFPTQQTAIDHALVLMDRHIRQDKTLFLFGSYSLGKERLFMEIAAKYQRKVCVSKAKLKIISTFGWPERQMRLLTTEAAATNLHVVPMMDLQMDHLSALLTKHRLRFHQIVAFRPTGWTFSKNSTQSISTCRTDPTGRIRVYGIPYSEHSSFAELCDFVQSVNPLEIIPTVNCASEKQVRRQVDALKQVAFHSITTLFERQQTQQTPASVDSDT